jgi:hypothetical protein
MVSRRYHTEVFWERDNCRSISYRQVSFGNTSTKATSASRCIHRCAPILLFEHFGAPANSPTSATSPFDMDSTRAEAQRRCAEKIREQIRERQCSAQIFRKKLTLAHRYSSQDADSTSDERSLHNGKQALSVIEDCQ